MIPWVSYILKTGFVSFSIVNNLEMSELSDRLTVQTYRVDEGACAAVFAVRTSGDRSSRLVIYPAEKPASESVYSGNYYEEMKEGKRVTTSVWDDYYLAQTARMSSDGGIGFSMPAATVLDKRRDFTFRVRVWDGGESAEFITGSVSCDPSDCLCREIPTKISD